MATIRNPINRNTSIDLLPTIKELQPAYGRFADSGLFKEYGIKTQAVMYKVDQQENTKMTKLTSRTERDSVRVSRGKSKQVTVGSLPIKLDTGVHVEDLQNILKDFDVDKDETLQEAVADATADMYNSFSQSYEYMLVTASQGQMRDPNDGSIANDMFVATGTTRSTYTIDVSDTSTTAISDINGLRNLLTQLNGYNGVVSNIEVWCADNAFDNLVNHPEFYALYQLAYQGAQQATIMQPILNGSINKVTLTPYGYSREFTWENITFRTYPQTFNAMDGTTLNAIPNGKGWTVVRGATNAYEVAFAPPPYFSQLNSIGQKIYARSTGIIDDTHIDLTIESHLIPILKRPELSVDITFKLT